MKVRLRSLMTGATCRHEAGSIIDVDDEQAAQLLDGRYADPVEDSEVEDATTGPSQTAVTGPGAKKRGKKPPKI